MPLVCTLSKFAVGGSRSQGLRKYLKNVSHSCRPFQHFQERKSSPKSKFWGRISRGRPRGYPGGRPGAKTSVRPSKSWKNKHMVPISMTRRRGRPWPEGVKENFGQKNFRLNFLSLRFGLASDCVMQAAHVVNQWKPKGDGGKGMAKTCRYVFQQVSRDSRLMSRQNMAHSVRVARLEKDQKRAEHGFGEYGFKHRAHWVFRGSLSSGERTQWVPLSLLFVCQSELTEFFAELTEFAAELSEFSSPSALETVFRPIPKGSWHDSIYTFFESRIFSRRMLR